MVNTDLPPVHSAMRPPQIISLPLFLSSASDSAPASSLHSNASTPELQTYSTSSSAFPLFADAVRPARRSLDSSSSTSTVGSLSSSVSRSVPSLSLEGAKRPIFDPLSLPASPFPGETPKPSRPRSCSGGHSYSYSSSSSPMTSSAHDARNLHPSHATTRSEGASDKRASYSALTQSFASLSVRDSPVLRQSRTSELSEEVRLEMKMFGD